MKKYTWILEVIAIASVFAMGVAALNAAESNPASGKVIESCSPESASAAPLEMASVMGDLNRGLEAGALAKGGDCPYKNAEGKTACDCQKAKDGSGDSSACDRASDCTSCAGKDPATGTCPGKADKKDKDKTES